MPAELARRQLMAVAAVLLAPSAALAGDSKPGPTNLPPPERDRSIAENYERAVAGTDLVIGGAIIGVNAPLSEVKKVLLSFQRYKQILPRVQQSRIVGEENGLTDVYLRAPILRGLSAIWAVMRFSPPKPWRTRGLQIDAAMVKGNMNKWTGTWLAFPCSARRTLLKIEMFVELDMPVPASLVTRELLWACRAAVTAARDMAECGTSSVKKD